jgi:NADH-quinone oxidoreductase subunit L
MFRLFFTVFYGEFRGEKEAYSHLHDPPNVMKIPLGVLAVGSVLAGYIGLPHLFSIPNVFEDFLSPVFAFVRKERWDFVYLFGMAVGEGTAMVFSILVSGVGIFLAYLFCLQRVDWKEKVTRWIYPLYTLLKNKFFVDEIYDWFLVRPLYFLAQFFVFRILDRIVVDGNIEGIGRGVRGVGGILQGISSGHLSIYLLFFGFVVLVLFWVFPF